MITTKIATQKWNLKQQIGDWTVAQLLEFMTLMVGEGPVHMPEIPAGVTLKEHMRNVGPWDDGRDAEEIIREIYEARTIGRDIEL